MLINCPNCKKPVSDMAESCIHCGYVLPKSERQTPKKQLIDAATLSKEEQKSLMQEFSAENPEEGKFLKTTSAIHLSLRIILFMTFLSLIPCGILFLKGMNANPEEVTVPTWLYLLIGVPVLLSIIAVVLLIKFKTRGASQIKTLKVLRSWAKEKGILVRIIYFGNSSEERAKEDEENLT